MSFGSQLITPQLPVPRGECISSMNFIGVLLCRYVGAAAGFSTSRLILIRFAANYAQFRLIQCNTVGVFHLGVTAGHEGATRRHVACCLPPR